MSIPLSRFWGFLLGSLCVLVVHPPIAFSLPRDQVERKFEQFLVFSIFSVAEADSQATLVFREDPEKKTMAAPAFVDRADAVKYLANLAKEDSAIKNMKVLGLPLTKLLKIRSDTQSFYGNGKKIDTPVVATANDLEKARELLLKHGASLDAINTRLTVPLFYTNPMILVDTSDGQKQAFFTSVDQLNSFIVSSKIDASRLESRAADINVIMGLMEKEEKDLYAVYPSPGYIKNRPDVLKN